MLKSKFENLKLSKVDLLTKDEQRNIRGGLGGAWASCGSDIVTCTGGSNCDSEDNVGCSCSDSNGNVVMAISCGSGASDPLPIG